ncbi:MAG: TolC family protein, partial [Candidatus Cryptobacteroides sp.]
MGKTHIKVAAMLLTALSLGSCGIYTKYQRPGIPVADSLYREIPTTADTSSIASLSWRELFSDSLLVGWIELALEKNTDLRIAELKVEEASANLLASRLAYLPSVGISAQFEAGNAGAAENNWSAGLSTEWELDIFGRLTNAKRQSYAALGQSEEYREAVRSRLIATVAENYYMLLTLDEKKAVTERTEENWEKTVRTLEALMDAGQTNRAAVSQARAELLAAR